MLPTREAILFAQKNIGYSEKGRPIVAYQIGDGDNCFFLFGGIHGNEKATTDLLNRFLDEVLADPGLVSPSKKLLIAPLVNPDGYYDRVDNLNANGVNLNRNFETMDWEPYQDSGTYAGNTPFSEAESRVIKKLVEDCQPVAMLAFHSQGALISPESNGESIQLAKWYADKTGYQYFDQWEYAGTATQWFVESTSFAAITVELPAHDQNDWETQNRALLELISDKLLID